LNGAEGILRLTYRHRKSGQTYIANQFYQLPLQVLPPYYGDDDGTAYTYILNPTGGVLQNDRLTVEVSVEQGARVLITTPSAGKFYRMEDGHAELINSFDVASGSVLEYLPEYNIPYAGTRILQETIFRLKRDSVLIAGDMIIPGRMERGELFKYDLYSSKTKIFIEDNLKAYEYIKLQPKIRDITGFGILQGRKIYGTMFVYAPVLPEEILNGVRGLFAENREVDGGISFLDESLGIVKLTGDTVSGMQEIMEEIWGIVRRHMLCKDRVRLRKF
jgi:urease accessory protein